MAAHALPAPHWAVLGGALLISSGPKFHKISTKLVPTSERERERQVDFRPLLRLSGSSCCCGWMAVGLVDRSEVSGVCCPGGVGVAAVVGSMQSLGRGRFLRDAELLRFARRNLLPSSARLLWVFTLDEHFFACKGPSLPPSLLLPPCLVSAEEKERRWLLCSPVLAPDVPSAEEDPDLEMFLACDITPLKPLWLFVKEVRSLCSISCFFCVLVGPAVHLVVLFCLFLLPMFRGESWHGFL